MIPKEQADSLHSFYDVVSIVESLMKKRLTMIGLFLLLLD